MHFLIINRWDLMYWEKYAIRNKIIISAIGKFSRILFDVMTNKII